MIEKVVIKNFRKFLEFEVNLSDGVNILVGDNDTGKSTLLDAINLALSGKINGRYLSQGLSPYDVNSEAVRHYTESLKSGKPKDPPAIIIEVFFKKTDELAEFQGTNNTADEDACGVHLEVSFSDEYRVEYDRFVNDASAIQLAPTEYYTVKWRDFADNAITARRIPVTSSLIDSSTIQLKPGVDHHLQEIVRTHLDPNERVELSRQYRSLREEFGNKEAVKSVNNRLQGDNGNVSDRALSLSIDLSHRYTWESSLAIHLDDYPFQFIGKGEQNTLKTLLALGQRADDAHVVLIEEPESHLSFTSLRRLISRIEQRCEQKQVLVATHSAYVLNKLGLGKLILLGQDGSNTKISNLPSTTTAYFKKLSGFDTLRLVLSKGVILVEGPSDELIVQRGYLDKHGVLPIENGIDVISVGTSHKRFLDLAVQLNRRVWAVVDNDGKEKKSVLKRFEDYVEQQNVSVHTGSDPEFRTLEPQIVEANDLTELQKILGVESNNKEELVERMLNNKTDSALRIFESERTISMPAYIQEVIDGQ